MPGSPFQYYITVTGKRPLKYSVENLPSGLVLDQKTGIITGKIQTSGEYSVILKAKNEFGDSRKNFTIQVGNDLSLTPPMGWNSWNVWALMSAPLLIGADLTKLDPFTFNLLSNRVIIAATKSGVMNEKIKNNVHLVNNLTVRIDTIQFIFSILWTNIIPAHQWQIQRGMSDFHVINYEDHPLSTTDYNYLHTDCLSFIKQELEKKDDTKNVVVTHHVPTFMNYPQKYRGDALNDAFAVELIDLIEAHGPDYWIYGHTHSNTANFEIGKTQLLTNQLGYVKYGEHENFNNKATFNI